MWSVISCSFMFQKENEQKRRRKSKAQFFDMIQEIRRFQREEKSDVDEIKEDEDGENNGEHVHGDKNTRDEDEDDTDRKFDAEAAAVQGLADNRQKDDCLESVVLEDVSCRKIPAARLNCLQHSVSSATDPGCYTVEEIEDVSSSKCRGSVSYLTCFFFVVFL